MMSPPEITFLSGGSQSSLAVSVLRYKLKLGLRAVYLGASSHSEPSSKQISLIAVKHKQIWC